MFSLATAFQLEEEGLPFLYTSSFNSHNCSLLVSSMYEANGQAEDGVDAKCITANVGPA